MLLRSLNWIRYGGLGTSLLSELGNKQAFVSVGYLDDVQMLAVVNWVSESQAVFSMLDPLCCIADSFLRGGAVGRGQPRLLT